MKRFFFLLVCAFLSFAAKAQSVGIGTTTPEPSTLLHVDAGSSTTRGIMVTGSYNASSMVPDLPFGSRLMFYPGKAAFRAGYTNSTNWSNSNTGDFSAATGYETTASGMASTAVGFGSTAAAHSTLASGIRNIANGYSSTVVGLFNHPIKMSPETIVSATTPLFIVGNGFGFDISQRSNAFVVRYDGKVGIGNINPDYALDVADRIRLRSGGSAASSAGLWLNRNDNSGPTGFIGVDNDNNIGFYGSGSGWSLVMHPTSGNVGVGTTSVSGAKLNVISSAGNQFLARTSPTGRGISLFHPGGAPTLGFNAQYVSSTYSFIGTGYGSFFQYDPGTGSLSYFSSLASGAANAAISSTTGSLLTIAANGNVGINTGSPSEKLYVGGNIRATGCVIASNVSCPSDIRFKTNISYLTNALPALLAIQPIYYQLNAREFPAKGFDEKMQIGFSAQEVEALFPEMVQTDAEGYKAVDYSRMTPILVQAVKEQQLMIEGLKEEKTRQQREIDDLKQQLNELIRVVKEKGK